MCVAYTHVCSIYNHVWVGAHIYVYMRKGQKKRLGDLLYYSLPYFLETGLSLSLEHDRWPASSSNPPVSVPYSTGVHGHAWLFARVLGIWTHVLMFVQQMLFYTEPSTQHPPCFRRQDLSLARNSPSRLGQLAVKTQRSTCLPLSNAWILSLSHNGWLFMWLLGLKLRSLFFKGNALLTELPSSPIAKPFERSVAESASSHG